MSYLLGLEQANELLVKLSEEYDIFGPKRYKDRGRKPGTDLIRYGKIQDIREIVLDQQSDFSPKEIFYPVSQTMFYFKNDTCEESELSTQKNILIFARACDINGTKRLDKIFLENGGAEDNYYKRLREKVHFVLMECGEGFEDCFCVSMNSNKTQDYDLAIRISKEEVFFEVKNPKFNEAFANAKEIDFTPEFVYENKKKVEIPIISSFQDIKTTHELPFWEEYNDRCISCGGCNTVCITCSCFDTKDIIYSETSKDGERKRIWSSCMLEDFSTMAGGHGVRTTAGQRMRFKTMHKVYDYKKRFNTDGHMCVGCGRCDIRCPKDISFPEAINRLSTELKSTGR